MNASGLGWFIFGGLVGAGITYFVMKDKVQQELDEIQGYYEHPPKEEEKKEEAEVAFKVVPSDKDVFEYAKRLASERYEYKEDEEGGTNSEVPHVIKMAEFGDTDGYGLMSYTYYADGVVTDENDIPLDDAQKILGTDYEARFKVADQDVVYVRNDILQNDYEIVRSVDPYYDGDDGEIEDPHLKKGLDYDDEDSDD